MNKKKYRYRIYGLIVESELCIPQAMAEETEESAVVDVEIHIGDIPDFLQKAAEQGYGSWIDKFNAAWFNTPGAAQFLVSGGDSIIVKPYPLANELLISSMILSAGLSLICLQRNEPVFHGGAIEKNGYAYIISGDSGAGKSTIAMKMLEEKETSFMADDTVRLTIRDELVYCHPTYPQQKVCRDLVLRLSLDINKLIYIDEERDKFAIERREKYYNHALALKAVFIIEKSRSSDMVSYRRLCGSEALNAFVDNLYLSHNYKNNIGMPSEFLQFVSVICKHANFFKIIRPEGRDTIDEVVQTIKFLQSC